MAQARTATFHGSRPESDRGRFGQTQSERTPSLRSRDGESLGLPYGACATSEASSLFHSIIPEEPLYLIANLGGYPLSFSFLLWGA